MRGIGGGGREKRCESRDEVLRCGGEGVRRKVERLGRRVEE